MKRKGWDCVMNDNCTKENSEFIPLKDTGNRTEFCDGALRDINSKNGRMDMLPFLEVGKMYHIMSSEYQLASQDAEMLNNCLSSKISNDALIEYLLKQVNEFAWNGIITCLEYSFVCFATYVFGDLDTAILELSIHYKEGAIKYSPHNWRKGLPLSSFIDSALRHLIKWHRGDVDEPHDRAVLWNLICCIWTFNNKQDCCEELFDLPYFENFEINLFK